MQRIVSDHVVLKEGEGVGEEEVYVDLSKLDFAKLKAAFEKTPRKNKLTYDLQKAIDAKLQQMLKENPLRLDFYDRYKEIIAKYNAGKSLENTVKAFDDLSKFVQDLSIEEKRVYKEELGDQETLAIFDLLIKDKELDSKEIKKVKKVAKETLEKLKEEKLKIERWRESREITAQIRIMIRDNLYHLPEGVYSEVDVELKSINVYQHIYTNYFGGGKSVYQQSA